MATEGCGQGEVCGHGLIVTQREVVDVNVDVETRVHVIVLIVPEEPYV